MKYSRRIHWRGWLFAFVATFFLISPFAIYLPQSFWDALRPSFSHSSGILSESADNDPQEEYSLGVSYLTGQNGQETNTSKALYWLNRAAEQGFAPAQFRLGLIYYYGQGQPQNFEKSIVYFSAAAKQNINRAASILCDIYTSGRGSRIDYTQAGLWCRQAAAFGSDYAAYQLSLLDFSQHEPGPNVSEGLGLLKQAAPTVPYARYLQEELATSCPMLDQPGAVRDNCVLSRFSRSFASIDDFTPLTEPERAEHGFLLAQKYGATDDKKDISKASALFIDAANSGFALAQFDLGQKLLQASDGKDWEIGKGYILKAALQKWGPAEDALCKSYIHGESHFSRDLTEGVRWCNNAIADHHSATGLYEIGVLKIQGSPLFERDIDGGLDMLDEAGREDFRTVSALSKPALPFCLSTKPMNADNALQCLLLAGNPDMRVQTKLGDLFYDGVFVPQDKKQASKRYKAAAIHRGLEASQKLSDMYAKGDGAPKDPVEAYVWATILNSENSRARALKAQLTPGELNSAKVRLRSYSSADPGGAQCHR